MSKFENVTDDELLTEIRRRSDSDRIARMAFRAERNRWILDHIDTILSFVPEHDRSACSDKKICNSCYQLESQSPRCRRCFLLAAKIEGYVDVDYALSLCISKVV